MVMRLMQPTHWQGKRVLDVGCGTGILGLLAGLLGAQEVALLDYDPLSTENAAENLAENPLAAEHCQFAIIQGELNVAPPGPYDVLLANINRNIHLEWGAKYRELLKPGGEIYLSGVLTVDSVKLLAYFSGLGFEPLAQLTQDDWWAAQLKRI
jgi:ribosomal protein L11 methyltransferase